MVEKARLATGYRSECMQVDDMRERRANVKDMVYCGGR